MAEECCFGLEKLKKEYEKMRKKYALPSFEEMNNDFEIEKLQERETETLLREIRRAMIEKNLAYLRFLEMFMNPSNAPMFFLVLVKNFDNNEKKLAEELYIKLGKFEIMSIALDNVFDEKKDAEFINQFYNEWQDIKGKFSRILQGVEKSWEKKTERREKGYLG